MSVVPASRIAVVAACMARGLTPEETDLVMAELEYHMPPWKASDIQRELEEAIARHKKPEPAMSDLVDYLFERRNEDKK